MLDHVSLRVQDLERAVAFYRAALAPIGYDVKMEFPGAIGLGAAMPDFWLMQSSLPVNPTHLAFSAERAQVDAFHSAALAAGGADNGPPGLRLEYHPHYYGAFIRDPEGNNVEVVCHMPPGMPKPPAARKAAARKPAKRAKAAKPARAKKSAKKPAKRAGKSSKKRR